MKGKEHGSSKWENFKTIKHFMNKEYDQNIIFSRKVRISSKKVKNFEYDRNKNVLVLGGSGSGKTYSIIKPNLLQLNSSYIITDPKGTLYPETKRLFLENGYKLKVFDTVNFDRSMHYNPLSYIHSEKDIIKIVDILIENTTSENHKGDEFWTKSEKLLYMALIGYMFEKLRSSEITIDNLMRLIDECTVDEENNDENQNVIDVLFEDLEKENPNSFALKQYKKFKMATGKTMKSILISCGTRLAPFDIKQIREITKTDDLELDEIGEEKTALFVIMSDTNSTFAFLIAMLMSQSFNILVENADVKHNGRLPFHVSYFLDEFANIGKIPDFERLISVIRSREISAIIILQSISQIESLYKDKHQIIVDNCDTLVFLGGKGTKTTKELSEMIGKTTIDIQTINESKGSKWSYSLNNSISGRNLLDPSEIGRLKRDECLILITGLYPFKDKKYNIKTHKRYHFLKG